MSPALEAALTVFAMFASLGVIALALLAAHDGIAALVRRWRA